MRAEEDEEEEETSKPLEEEEVVVAADASCGRPGVLEPASQALRSPEAR